MSMRADEVAPLLGDFGKRDDETGQLCGLPVKIDSGSWHWAIVFPLITDEPMPKKYFCISQGTVREYFDQQMSEDEIKKEAKEIFTPRTMKEYKVDELLQGTMKRKDFHQKARAILVEILTSRRNGFKLGTMESVDKDELILLIELPYDPQLPAIMNMPAKMAMRQDMKMPIKPGEYEKVKGDQKYMCPTEAFISGTTFDKNAPAVPMHVRFDTSCMEKFQDFREVDLIKMVRRRLKEFVNFQGMQRVGFCKMVFPVHKYEMVEHFHNIGWSNLKAVCQRPSEKYTDRVRDYFGEEVGFFFHWLNTYTKWLTAPAILGFVCYWRRHVGLPLDEQRYIQMSFAALMTLWSACFAAFYPQAASMKKEKWGMRNYAITAAPRKEFKREMQGMWQESARRNFHWGLASLFMLETVLATAAINIFRAEAKSMGADDTMFGMSAATAGKVGKYLITLNIKAVDVLWGVLTPSLSLNDNWRTDLDLKDAMVNKMFGVKFIVYYYPFFYYAFLMEHIDGCPGDTPRGCMDTLVLNLEVFFMTHIATVLAGIVLPIILFQYAVRSEIQKTRKGTSGKDFSYIQAQAKCAEYLGDTDDMMELVLSLGFLMMFAVALPVMASIAWFCNILEVRLHAYKMITIMRRADPRGQEGIGSWDGIIKIVSKMAVIVNVGMAVFVMHPIKNKKFMTKLLIFIVAEHIMLSITMIIEKATPTMDLATATMAELTENISDEILDDENKPVLVEPSRMIKLPIDAADAQVAA